MAQDFGRITPGEDGRWRWPFAKMEKGDFFSVGYVEREPQKVRMMAAARGYQLSRHFSCVEGEDVLIVTREDERRRARIKIRYDHFRQLAMLSYGIDTDAIGWLELVSPRLFEAKPRAFAGVKALRVDVAPGTFDVDFRADGMWVKPVLPLLED